MAAPHRRGALIVVEGVDRAGKTTQCQRLAGALNTLGHPTELMKFPNRTTAIGQLINDYLANGAAADDRAIHLLFSANRWEAAKGIRNTLWQGTSLVLDRYAFSGAAYTSAKAGMSLEWCTACDVGLPEPDLCIFLSMDPEAAARRGGYGDERYETTDFQLAVTDRFKEIIAYDLNLHWKIVDADRSAADIHQDLMAMSCCTIELSSMAGGLGSLWINSERRSFR